MTVSMVGQEDGHDNTVVTPQQEQQQQEQQQDPKDTNEYTLQKEPETFEELGLAKPLIDACHQLGYTAPTPIQRRAIPVAMSNRDLIALAQTGSGKTAAFTLPMLEALLKKPQPFFGVVLAPTRELAVQIAEQVEAIGAGIGVKAAVVVGGVDMMAQSIVLSKKPHIVVATPGRLVDHLENTKGFSLKRLQWLVLDEADRLLNMDFGPELDKILKAIPRERRTMLFSATMTSKVAKLQRASLVDPVRVEVSTKYSTVDTLLQSYLFVPQKLKDAYLVAVLTELAGQTAILFVSTCNAAQRVALLLRNLGFPAIPLHGQMPQVKRLGALQRFKAGDRSILVATDVAARGLDIPSVDLVINYDLPAGSKDYVHRVGRTARAGRSGRAIAIVTQYDVEQYQKIEQDLGKKLPAYDIDKQAAVLIGERVQEAGRAAILQMKESVISGVDKGGKRRRGGKVFSEDAKESTEL